MVCQGLFSKFLTFLNSLQSVFLADACSTTLEGCEKFCSPLVILVYHRPHQKSTGNVAQLWEIARAKVCAICLLTFYGGGVIIKIRVHGIHERGGDFLCILHKRGGLLLPLVIVSPVDTFAILRSPAYGHAGEGELFSGYGCSFVSFAVQDFVGFH